MAAGASRRRTKVALRPLCVLDGLNGLVNGGRGRRRRLDPSHTLLGSWRLESPASCCRVDDVNARKDQGIGKTIEGAEDAF